MKTLLHLNSSLYGDLGQSSQLAGRFVAGWRSRHPDGQVLFRDLSREPVPHLTAETFGAFLAKPETRSAEQRKAVAYSDRLIDELKRADAIVLALPMYNFGVPSTLKAYFDHVARAGITFRYTEKGPLGLLTGKKAYVFSTRGGVHAGTPSDSETAYLRTFLSFLGIGDIQFVYAEGLALGESHKQEALAKAREAIEKLQAPELAFAA